MLTGLKIMISIFEVIFSRIIDAKLVYTRSKLHLLWIAILFAASKALKLISVAIKIASILAFDIMLCKLLMTIPLPTL
jgi:tRNA threonylcarbamoyladenosine modification (KEOPS) complex Cgi121 subunit